MTPQKVADVSLERLRIVVRPGPRFHLHASLDNIHDRRHHSILILMDRLIQYITRRRLGWQPVM
jgi:hypothetical protein